MKPILKEDIKVEVCEIEIGDTIDEAIAALQAAREKVPPEFRSIATVNFVAYDWEGVFVEYVRPPTAEERAEAEAIFSDRARLIERTSAEDMKEWIRNIRMRYCGAIVLGQVPDAAQAEDLIRADELVVDLHPKYNCRTRLITN